LVPSETSDRGESALFSWQRWCVGRRLFRKVVVDVVGVWYGGILYVRDLGRELRAGGRGRVGGEAVGPMGCDRVGVYAIPVADAVRTSTGGLVAFGRGEIRSGFVLAGESGSLAG
jgi:hypothetical protein